MWTFTSVFNTDFKGSVVMRADAVNCVGPCCFFVNHCPLLIIKRQLSFYSDQKSHYLVQSHLCSVLQNLRFLYQSKKAAGDCSPGTEEQEGSAMHLGYSVLRVVSENLALN